MSSRLLQAHTKAHWSWRNHPMISKSFGSPLRKLCACCDTWCYFKTGIISDSCLKQQPEPAVGMYLFLLIHFAPTQSFSGHNPFKKHSGGSVTERPGWSFREERTSELAATSPPSAEPTCAAFRQLTLKSDSPWLQNLLPHWVLLPFRWILPFLPVSSSVQVVLSLSERKRGRRREEKFIEKKSQVCAKFANRASLHQNNELQRTVIFWGTGRS